MPSSNFNTSIVTCRIRAGGTPMPPCEVVSITVAREVNRIPSARIVLLDGNAAEQDFPLSGQPLLQPGKDIEILAGYDSQDKTIFKGIITRLRTRAKSSSNTELILDCSDKSVSLTEGRHSACHPRQSDSTVMKSLIQAAGLRAAVQTTTVTQEDLVQFNATDWDFIVTRAEANGMLVFVHDGEVAVKEPAILGIPSHEATFGTDLIEFEAQLEDTADKAKVSAETWDAATQKPERQGAGTKSRLQHGGARSPSELKCWIQAVKSRAGLARARGRARIQGAGGLLPGQLVTLGGIGKNFGKLHFVSGVEHEIADGNWTTEIQFGLASRWFHQRANVVEPPAAGLLPAVAGLQIGIVTKIAGDPRNEFRVQVRLPLVDAQGEGLWARVARLDAGAERGIVFLPEVGDEVVLGFLSNDPRDAIVLGMLHSSKKASPIAADEKNPSKGLTTRSKLQLLFDDEKKVITIATPAGNRFVLDEENKKITLTDQHKNSVALSETGILLTGQNHTVELGSSGVTVKSQSDIVLKATGNITLEGVNVEAKANAQFKAIGQTGAEVSTSGIAILKGSLVQIN
ncbi:MAG TPA: type VI secretion system tip protein VgrG [Verrucomicrobiota bacterium]|nr:type VI secretion system tip protein VgrG [Verrucomicrobiota bacterium]